MKRQPLKLATTICAIAVLLTAVSCSVHSTEEGATQTADGGGSHASEAAARSIAIVTAAASSGNESDVRLELAAAASGDEYILQYRGERFVNPNPEQYGAAELVAVMDGRSMQLDRIVIIRFDDRESGLAPLYGVIGFRGDELVMVNDPATFPAMPSLSPDGGRFAFMDPNGRALYAANLQTGEMTRFDLLRDDLTNSILRVQWVDADLLALEGHINPWVSSYATLNVSDGSQGEPVYGIFFFWSQGRLYVVPGTPHGLGGKSIQTADGREVYASDPAASIVKGLAVNRQGDRIAFFEQNDDSDKTTLVVGTLGDDDTLRIDKRLPYDGAAGEPVWRDDDRIEVPSGDTQITIQL